MEHVVTHHGCDALSFGLLDRHGLLDSVLCSLDPDEGTLHFSRCWQEFSGYHPEEAGTLEAFCDLAAAFDRAKLSCGIQTFLRQRQKRMTIDFCLRQKGGSLQPVTLKLGALQEPGKRPKILGLLSRRESRLPKDMAETSPHLSQRLQKALLEGEFRLDYQPQFDMGSGRLSGLEALLRWQDPRRGLIAPLEFIPAAEKCGLMMPIGFWVLRQVCQDLRQWQRGGLQTVPVAVNISTTQFLHPDFFLQLQDLLQESGIDPALLELEITESLYLDTSRDIQQKLDRLRDLGLSIALDDFGTGYSSLTYIKHFKLDRLKIDQSFIRGLQSGSVDAAITRTIVTLAHVLQLKVVAEGVETREQFDYLKSIGCNTVQGFYTSPPVPERRARHLLA